MDRKITKKQEVSIRIKKEAQVYIHKRNFTIPKKKGLLRPASKNKIPDIRQSNIRRQDKKIPLSKKKEPPLQKESVADISTNQTLSFNSRMNQEISKNKAINKERMAFKKKKMGSGVFGSSPVEKSVGTAYKGIKSGGKAGLEQLEGGNEVNDSLQVLTVMKKPIDSAVVSGKQIYQKKHLRYEKNRMKVKEKDPKIKQSRQLARNINQEKSKLQSKQLKRAVHQRKMAYFINKITNAENKDSILNVSKDIIKMKAAMVTKNLMKYLLSLLGPLLGGLLMTALPFILIIVLLYNSPSAIFLPKLADGESTQEVLSEYYQDFNARLAAEQNGQDLEITYLNAINGSYKSNFMDVLMVYMVLHGTGNTGTDMNTTAKNNLKVIFDEMNSFERTSVTTTVKAGESLGELTISAYCSCRICCGIWSGGPTASGRMPTANHTLAVDAFNPTIPFGTKVIIDGVEYIVEDTGNFAQYDVDLDMYFDKHQTATEYGHKKQKVFLADGDTNEIEVTRYSIYVKNLNYEDYIMLGKLTKEQESLLREVMSEDFLAGMPGTGIGNDVAALVLTKVGYPYSQDSVLRMTTHYDCSSLVYRCYEELGMILPGIASTQGQYIVEQGLEVTEDMLQPGDIIFYSYENNGQFKNISHVAIYVGDGMQVDARGTAYGVVHRPLVKSNVGLYGRPAGIK